MRKKERKREKEGKREERERDVDDDLFQKSLQQPREGGRGGGTEGAVPGRQTEENVPEESHLLGPGQCRGRGQPQSGGDHQVTVTSVHFTFSPVTKLSSQEK